MQRANIFSSLPPLMLTVLNHEQCTDINIAIGDEHKLTAEQRLEMIKIIRQIILKTLEPNKLVTTVQQQLGLQEDEAKSVSLDLLGRRFLPMEWYLGGVSEEIRKLGGDIAKFETEARKNYPEVYEPQAQEQAEPIPELVPTETSQPLPVEQPATEPTILHNLDERLTSTKGRAEILLRMTALSQQVEQVAKTGELTDKESQELLHTLDSLSYAVNTQDLNPLEINAIKRRLRSVVSKIPTG